MSSKQFKVHKNRSYFFAAVGKNADIKRHREQEQEIREKISKAKDAQTRKIYKYFLDLLLASKAECVSKIGKK